MCGMSGGKLRARESRGGEGGAVSEWWSEKAVVVN